jgi:hypothetical protein
MAAYNINRWVSQHNVAADGSGVFGRHAQEHKLLQHSKSTIDTNSAIRDTDTVVFNLIASFWTILKNFGTWLDLIPIWYYSIRCW